ncbi:hypothetical protein Glove_426g46 [Diversispora epigaea]|uniref:Zinc-ribbon domain-containing protein n=1 Tax=Diversispora epigaea TaxID=1348612 RepID=A0A397GYM6_9GLOM|nr:hypothetical protein Glove_426g46 [Diversispora epigaea]
MTRLKYSLKTAQNLAESHRGHEWERQLYAVKSGSWCLQCSWDNQKAGLQVAREIALNKNGECLSEVYINNNSSLIWRCALHHEFTAPLRYVKSMGRWCKICSKEKRKNIDPKYEPSNLSTAIKIAHTHRGKCLSSSYVDNSSPLLWECSEGHR